MPPFALDVIVSIASVIAGAILMRFALRTEILGLRSRIDERARDLGAERIEVARLRDALSEACIARERVAATLEAERDGLAEKVGLLDHAREQLKDAFASASQDALQRNNQAFLDLAHTKLSDFQLAAQTEFEARRQSIDLLVKPVNEGLQLVGDRLLAFDKERATAHATLQENLRSMASSQQHLLTETDTLVRALRAPHVRGQWGELQLERVVELAGMVEHCDFVQQESVNADAGRLRPDMVVRLPGRKLVVVDSKAPLSAYLDAMEATDEGQRDAYLDQHAKQVRDHVVALSNKDYANEFTEAPNFVVMFLPGESFFSAACQRDPNLIDFAIQHNVIPASPTTLITVLKAVNYGWQQERIAKNAEEIRDLGQMLYERIRGAAEHLGKVRRGLEAAVSGYNSAVGALESRVLPTARKFRDMGVGAGDEVLVLEAVDSMPRFPTAPELRESMLVA